MPAPSSPKQSSKTVDRGRYVASPCRLPSTADGTIVEDPGFLHRGRRRVTACWRAPPRRFRRLERSRLSASSSSPTSRGSRGARYTVRDYEAVQETPRRIARGARAATTFERRPTSAPHHPLLSGPCECATRPQACFMRAQAAFPTSDFSKSWWVGDRLIRCPAGNACLDEMGGGFLVATGEGQPCIRARRRGRLV